MHAQLDPQFLSPWLHITAGNVWQGNPLGWWSRRESQVPGSPSRSWPADLTTTPWVPLFTLPPPPGAPSWGPSLERVALEKSLVQTMGWASCVRVRVSVSLWTLGLVTRHLLGIFFPELFFQDVG